MCFSVSKKGQALIEYLLLVVFVITLSSRLVGNFTDFMRSSVGNLGHVMTINLTVGVCERNCFFGNYRNGFEP